MARWVVCVAASSDKRSHSSTKAMTALDERQCGSVKTVRGLNKASTGVVVQCWTSQGLSLSEGQEIGSQLRSVKESIPDVVTTPTLKASRKNPPGASWMKNCCQFFMIEISWKSRDWTLYARSHPTNPFAQRKLFGWVFKVSTLPKPPRRHVPRLGRWMNPVPPYSPRT